MSSTDGYSGSSNMHAAKASHPLFDQHSFMRVTLAESMSEAEDFSHW